MINYFFNILTYPMLLRRWMAAYCDKAKYYHIGFMDPIIVNEKTYRGEGYVKAHMTEVVTTSVKGFLKQRKMNILLACNCECLFSSFILVITIGFLKILVN
jgi:hypothetical protein